MGNFPNWIEEKMIRGARGFNLDSYLMALEGWRRGLTLTWYSNVNMFSDIEIIGFNPIGKSFSLKDENSKLKHYFYRSRGDLVSNSAVHNAHDKFYTKEALINNGVPTPKGFQFGKDTELENILNQIHTKQLTYPVVVKPVFGSLGKGIITNIHDEVTLASAINQIKVDKEYNEYIVEEQIDGQEYRLYVVDEEIVAITERVPANITGNGKNTILELIKLKNIERENNVYLKTKLIPIDDEVESFLLKQNLSLDTILEQGKVVYIRKQGNITRAGADPVNISNPFNQKTSKMITDSLKSIEGLKHAGIDVIVRDGIPYIIEMNATAGISMHMFPYKGEPINVPEKIIDAYFPNTKNLSNELKNMYFNYRDVSQTFRSNYAESITMMDAPKGTLYTKRFIVKGRVQGVGYRHWIRKQAVLKGINGYVRNLKNGNVVVVTGSTNKKAISDFKNICKKGPLRADVKEVKELSWDKSIQLGFIIKKSQ